MTIVIPDWLTSAAIGFIFCSFLYAAINRVVMYISDRVSKNNEIAFDRRLKEMSDAASRQIREKHGIEKEA